MSAQVIAAGLVVSVLWGVLVGRCARFGLRPSCGCEQCGEGA